MANGKQLSQDGADEILDIIDSYINVEEDVEEWFKKTYPDYCRGDTPLEPYYSMVSYAWETADKNDVIKLLGARYKQLLTDKGNLINNLKHEKELNAEIKARFVKCNTCTPDMKEKCLMFNENLCEGERCEELVDIMSLVEKRDTDDELAEARELLQNWYANNRFNAINSDLCKETEKFLEKFKHF